MPTTASALTTDGHSAERLPRVTPIMSTKLRIESWYQTLNRAVPAVDNLFQHQRHLIVTGSPDVSAISPHSVNSWPRRYFRNWPLHRRDFKRLNEARGLYIWCLLSRTLVNHFPLTRMHFARYLSSSTCHHYNCKHRNAMHIRTNLVRNEDKCFALCQSTIKLTLF